MNCIEKRAQQLFIATACIFGVFVFSTPIALAQQDDPEDPPAPLGMDTSKFYCKTRYGLKIEGEAARRAACQKGYETGECEAETDDDEDGTIKACNEGSKADKDLVPEPEANKIKPNVVPDPPRLQAQSGTKNCAGVDTAFLSCQIPAAFGLQGTGIGAMLTIAINIMTIIAGTVAVGALVYAGIIYSSSRDDSTQVKKAKDIIKNTIVGLVLFVALYIVIEFIVPGGVF